MENAETVHEPNRNRTDVESSLCYTIVQYQTKRQYIQKIIEAKQKKSNIAKKAAVLGWFWAVHRQIRKNNGLVIKR